MAGDLLEPVGDAGEGAQAGAHRVGVDAAREQDRGGGHRVEPVVRSAQAQLVDGEQRPLVPPELPGPVGELGVPPALAAAEPVRERCTRVYLIGEAADALAADIAPTGVPLERAGDLERAVAAARARAAEGGTVLLSPACASFDQYADFEQRGDHFRALAQT